MGDRGRQCAFCLPISGSIKINAIHSPHPTTTASSIPGTAASAPPVPKCAVKISVGPGGSKTTTSTADTVQPYSTVYDGMVCDGDLVRFGIGLGFGLAKMKMETVRM